MFKRVLFVAVLFAPITAFGDIQTVRVSDFDWQCQDSQGAVISNHVRFDTAFVACVNNPQGAFVQGGRYRITKPDQLATVSWIAPTTYENGITITEAITYRVEYGNDPANLNQFVLTAASPYIFQLSSGTWYFAIKAIVNGMESNPTQVVSKVIR